MSSQVTFIYVAFFTIQIVSKLHSDNMKVVQHRSKLHSDNMKVVQHRSIILLNIK